jgi:hypothetical protein
MPSVGVRTVENADYLDPVLFVVNPINDPVCAPACAVAVGQGRAKPFPHPMRVIQQRSDDELMGRERNRLRELLGQLPSGGRGDP